MRATTRGTLKTCLATCDGHDVAVVAFGDGDKAVGVLDAGPAQDVGVGAVADDLVALEIVGQDAARGSARELVGIPVDDHDLVAGLVHVGGDLRADPTAANDEELQGG